MGLVREGRGEGSGGQVRAGEDRAGGGKHNLNRPNHRAHTHGKKLNPRRKTTKHRERKEEHVTLVYSVCLLAAVCVSSGTLLFFLALLLMYCIVVVGLL